MTADPRELARRVLALAAAGEVQVTVTRTSVAALRFTRALAQEPVVSDELEVHVLVLRDGHPGAALARGTGEQELATALDEAAAAAASAAACPTTGSHPGLTGPQPVRSHDGYDPATARHEAAPAAAAIAAALAAAGTHDVRGAWTTGLTEIAIASSTGLDLHDRTTRAVLDVVLRDPGTGREAATRGAGVRAGGFDASDVVERALLALVPGEPVTIEPGPLEVVLGPEAVAAVLTHLGRTAFDGLAHAEGRGALAGRLGTRVAASAINLADSPRFARTLPSAFDLDGVPKAPVPLIQDGVAHRVVHDLCSAARAGGAARSTGHATAPGGGADGPRPEHLVLIGGGAADVAELCVGVDRGLYVGRLAFGSHFGEPIAIATGIARIERGAIVGPADSLRLTADPLAILRGVEALTMAQWLVPHGPRGGIVAPALRTGGLAVIDAA